MPPRGIDGKYAGGGAQEHARGDPRQYPRGGAMREVSGGGTKEGIRWGTPGVPRGGTLRGPPGGTPGPTLLCRAGIGAVLYAKAHRVRGAVFRFASLMACIETRAARIMILTSQRRKSAQDNPESTQDQASICLGSTQNWPRIDPGKPRIDQTPIRKAFQNNGYPQDVVPRKGTPSGNPG